MEEGGGVPGSWSPPPPPHNIRAQSNEVISHMDNFKPQKNPHALGASLYQNIFLAYTTDICDTILKELQDLFHLTNKTWWPLPRSSISTV